MISNQLLTGEYRFNFGIYDVNKTADELEGINHSTS